MDTFSSSPYLTIFYFKSKPRDLKWRKGEGQGSESSKRLSPWTRPPQRSVDAEAEPRMWNKTTQASRHTVFGSFSDNLEAKTMPMRFAAGREHYLDKRIKISKDWESLGQNS